LARDRPGLRLILLVVATLDGDFGRRRVYV